MPALPPNEQEHDALDALDAPGAVYDRADKTRRELTDEERDAHLRIVAAGGGRPYEPPDPDEVARDLERIRRDNEHGRQSSRAKP